MGGLSNDSTLLARYAGLYKGVQSAGIAVAFGVDAAGVSPPYPYPMNWFCPEGGRVPILDILVQGVFCFRGSFDLLHASRGSRRQDD